MDRINHYYYFQLSRMIDYLDSHGIEDCYIELSLLDLRYRVRTCKMDNRLLMDIFCMYAEYMDLVNPKIDEGLLGKLKKRMILWNK